VSTLTGLGETGLRLQLDRPAKVNAFTIPQPPRLVIDLDAVEVPDAALVGFAPPAWVADYRYGQIVGGRFRLLFDLAVPVRLVRLAPDGNDPKVLRIDLSPVRSNETPATVAVSLSYDPAQEPTPTAPSQKRPRGKPVVVIDPGHGGIDPGAVAASGILEKDIVLAVAQEVRRSLSALGRYDVRMTRDTDQLVRLGDRVRFAETAGAELFISIHADTFVGQPGAGAVRGGSVYVLGEDVSRSAAEFAAKENAADAVAGVVETAAVVDKQVAPILADLVARETADLSLRAQGLLIRDLRRAMTLAREPARAAGFRVLRQADVPSVLIELGYMSNAADTAQLQSAEWQRSVAAAITRAIDGYFSTTASSRGRSATP
jgi:N-acetylmuramoyl-L-alanine amidase